MSNESTMRRMLRQVDVAQLEKCLAEYGQHLALQHAAPPTVVTSMGEALRGQALDGKEVRGLRVHGRPLHLLTLV